jgi:hypothetical protein
MNVLERRPEPTRSFGYRFARYQAIPEIMERPETIDGRPFHLMQIRPCDLWRAG